LHKNSTMPGTFRPPQLRPRSRIVEKPEELGESEVLWDWYNNTSFIEMFAHSGTHIDAPFHADMDGLTVTDFDWDFGVFENPVFIEFLRDDGEEITKEDLEEHADEIEGSDLLLIYTGHSKYRQSDPDRYKDKQPSITPEAGEYLAENFPSLRAIGIDCIAIECIVENSPEFPCHHELLDGRKFFQMEDANLAPLRGEKLIKVFIQPLRLTGSEAAPVLAFAEVEE